MKQFKRPDYWVAAIIVIILILSKLFKPGWFSLTITAVVVFIVFYLVVKGLASASHQPPKK